MSDICYVHSFHIDYNPITHTNRIYVKAMLENRVLLRHATLEDPQEWGSGLCETHLVLGECNEKMELNENQLVELLEENDCVWELCEV